MIKDIILELTFVQSVTDEGKSILKSRRFNQVKLQISDAESKAFAQLISNLTGEMYIAINKIEKKEI
ncbi:DUF1659 domain-containing protein [Macrococcus armenti]|uniref:DUF1659 domain-containing protein n=1 Tax=Macrococcus armenti TaxID=2875764 RepID=UPI001CCDD02B|nr:DUF1659 domain-containing protein [Macrococcus armenti]UBH09642.1 DUF1659 domain-containing protein [Macrococcus armenti]UBH11916.1 DUF1659 domain-containing protein [Macrococcus armenti]UBH12099.1 DUF1659 domain-containing protein [Macrococcus armenti]UBH23373.1 DUF1659 domain-containing protein [Macrococcus armenti]